MVIVFLLLSGQGEKIYKEEMMAINNIVGREAKLEKKRKTKFSWVSLFVEYKGKRLRILIGIVDAKEIINLRHYVYISFSFQSPKEEKDDLRSAMRNIRMKIKNGKYFLIRKKDLNIENLYVLSMAYPLLDKEISWIKKTHFLDFKEI